MNKFAKCKAVFVIFYFTRDSRRAVAVEEWPVVRVQPKYF